MAWKKNKNPGKKGRSVVKQFFYSVGIGEKTFSLVHGAVTDAYQFSEVIFQSVDSSCVNESDQIIYIATSHDLGPQNVAFWKGNPLISGKSRLVKYCNLVR